MSEWVSWRRRYVGVSREALCRLIFAAVMVLNMSCQERAGSGGLLGDGGLLGGMLWTLHTALTACYAWLLSS
jgi:hypothetical protein